MLLQDLFVEEKIIKVQEKIIIPTQKINPINKNNWIQRDYQAFYFSEKYNSFVNDMGEVLEIEGSLGNEAFFEGAKRLLDDEFYTGNMANSIFKTVMMLRDDGVENEDILNFMTKEYDNRGGKNFNKFMQIIRSAFRK